MSKLQKEIKKLIDEKVFNIDALNWTSKTLVDETELIIPVVKVSDLINAISEISKEFVLVKASEGE